MNAYLYSKQSDVQNVLTTWEASYSSAPCGNFKDVENLSIITTYLNTSKEISYTSSLIDIVTLFETN